MMDELKALRSEVIRELTIYENDEEPETTQEEWCDNFYYLLVRFQDIIDIAIN